MRFRRYWLLRDIARFDVSWLMHLHIMQYFSTARRFGAMRHAERHTPRAMLASLLTNFSTAAVLLRYSPLKAERRAYAACNILIITAMLTRH